jgi:hypothetical protein
MLGFCVQGKRQIIAGSGAAQARGVEAQETKRESAVLSGRSETRIPYNPFDSLSDGLIGILVVRNKVL